MKKILLLLFSVWLAGSLQGEVRSDLTYGRAGGEDLKLDIGLPDGAGPFPAVIFVHGGGWTGGDKQAAGIAPLFAPLNAAGIAWISVNYRLAPKHPFPACADDVETAVRWVKANAVELKVDPHQLGLVGFSAGGHLAALVGLRGGTGLDVQAVASFSGVFDLNAYLAAAPKVSEVFGLKAGDPALPALLRAASPVAHTMPGLPPVLLVHGTADDLVAPAQPEKMQMLLKGVGAPVERIAVEGGKHNPPDWVARGSDFQAQFVAWLRRTLPAGAEMVSDQLATALRRNPPADVDGDGTLTRAEAKTYFTVPPPTWADVSYGPHPRNVFDYWQAKSAAPTPLVIFIHGGGFTAGSKAAIEPAFLRGCLAAGVSCMAINYRLLDSATVNEIVRDAARALQFVRYHAADYHLDPKRIAAYGGSAGAGTTLWLGFHDDLADPANPDPVRRESTRLVAVGAQQTQATYDMLAWEPIVGPYKPAWRKNAPPAPADEAVPGAMFFHMKTRAELESPAGRAMRADIDMLSLITRDDPPAFFYNREPGGPANGNGHWWHHPNHALAVKARLDTVGVENEVFFYNADPRSTGDFIESMRLFFFRHLGVSTHGK